MTAFRITLMVLAIVHMLFAGFTALVGAFADGGNIWERLVVSALHPIVAIALLALIFVPRPPKTFIIVITGLLTANIIADVTFAISIAAGVVKGDAWLALVFSVVPAIALIYAINRLRIHNEISGTTPVTQTDAPTSE